MGIPRPNKSHVFSTFTGHGKIPLHAGFWPCQCTIRNVIRILLSRNPALANNGRPTMIREMAFATKQELTTETLLWRGVIARTIQDWLSGPLRPKREAERYLFENSVDLSLVCQSAGIDVGQLRKCLNKVRGRTLRDLLPVAA